jgi:hypothetical protein
MMLNSSLMDEEELATRQKARKCFNSWCLDCSMILCFFPQDTVVSTPISMI